MDYVIGVDVGSQSTKALLVALDGTLVGEAAAGYGIDYPQPLWAEQPVARWTNAFTQAVRRLLAETGVDPRRVRATKAVMESFALWLEQHAKGRAVFVSDNVAFDWQFINYYFHRFLGRNPFGFSGRRIGDLYAGLVKDASKATEWKRYRVTKHTHNPVDDARGNAEALKKFRELGLKI